MAEKKTADRIYWIHALTPLHVGSGRGEGYIDLPLVREKVTNYPFVPGSSVKGVIADHYGATKEQRSEKEGDSDDAKNAKALHRIGFGMIDDEEGNNGRAGAIVFTDARLVCLPIRSLYGTFAWCTSPWVLQRFKRDLDAMAINGLPDLATESPCLVGELAKTKLTHEGKAYLEDLDFVCEESANVKTWAQKLAAWLFDDETWQGEFRSRFAVLPDDAFNFLCETGTEVQAHIRIEQEYKRVASGALWYEESLPTEAILAGLIWCDKTAGDRRDDILKKYCQQTCDIQIGGKASVGKGRARCKFTE